MLTNAAVKAARPAERAYKLYDAGGLLLHVAVTGTRSWRMKCRVAGVETLLTFGRFPDLSLTAARALRDEARSAIDRGADPRPIRDATTFEPAARAWHAHQAVSWSIVHADDVLTSLERDVFPAIGASALSAIKPAAIAALLAAVERRGSIETARRLRQRISSVFRFAIALGWGDTDPAEHVAQALSVGRGVRQQLAIIEIEPARALLAAIGAVGTPARATQLLALTAVRSAALRGARWEEISGIDWTDQSTAAIGATWTIPAARMKLTAARKHDAVNDHVVPLSAQAVALLRLARAANPGAPHIFPGRGGMAPIGEGALRDANAAGGGAGRHVPHGWRATFSTIMNERFPAERAAIDRVLAHKGGEKVELAYNRAAHLAQRRNILQRWADLILPAPRA